MNKNKKMYKISIVFLFLILFISNVYSQFPESYPFETYLDAAENLYVAGDDGHDLTIWKYNSAGIQLMMKTFSSGGISKGMDIVANADGTNIYVAGYFFNIFTGNYDIQILKYADNGIGGILLWHREYENMLGHDKAYGIAIDASENIYVCGYTTNFDMTTDYILIKYNSAGIYQWERKYGSTENDVATDILTDNNYIYLMGYKDEPVSGLTGGVPTKDAMLVAYNINDLIPIPTILDLPGSSEIPTSFIISEHADNTNPPTVSMVAIAGEMDRIVGRVWDKNYFIAYFDRNPIGNQNIVGWSTDWGEYPHDDIATGITSDNAGNLVVTGYFMNDTSDDFGTLKFNKENGNIMWGAITYDDQGGIDRASSIFRFDSIYAISGYSQFSSTNLFITKRFDETNPDMLEVWSNYYEPDVISNPDWQYCTNFSTETYILHDSSFITVGFGWGEDVSAFAIIKYDPAGSLIYDLQPVEDRPGMNSFEKVQRNSAKREFTLKQNYPNPFNPVTMISYSIPEQSYVTLKVYDMLGREVAEIVNTSQNAGNYHKRFDGSDLASGIYIYKLTAISGNNRYEKISKMTLIK